MHRYVFLGRQIRSDSLRWCSSTGLRWLREQGDYVTCLILCILECLLNFFVSAWVFFSKNKLQQNPYTYKPRDRPSSHRACEGVISDSHWGPLLSPASKSSWVVFQHIRYSTTFLSADTCLQPLVLPQLGWVPAFLEPGRHPGCPSPHLGQPWPLLFWLPCHLDPTCSSFLA